MSSTSNTGQDRGRGGRGRGRGRGRGWQTDPSNRASSPHGSVGRGAGQGLNPGRDRGVSPGLGRGRGTSSGPGADPGVAPGRGGGQLYTQRPPGPGPGRGMGPDAAPGRGSGQFHAQGPYGRGAGAPFQPTRGGADRGRGGPPRGRPAGGAIFMPDRSPSVDARIKDGSDKAVLAALNAGGTQNPNGLPLRPDYGTQGRPVVLRANYFPVQVEGSIHQYRAEIELDDKRRKVTGRVKRRVFWLAERTEVWKAEIEGRVAHDGADKLVACAMLAKNPLVICGPYYDEDEEAPAQGGTEYTLTLTYLEEVDQEILKECLAGKPVDSQALPKVLSALNLVLTARPSQTGTKVGRGDESKKHPDQRLFFDNPDPKDIGGGLMVQQGFYVSARPAHQQLMVNVNTCHAAFYKPQNFAAALQEYRRLDSNMGAFGKQVRVKTRPDGRIVMIQGISKRNANEMRFNHKTHGYITIAQYYDRHHNIRLTQPDLPLLEGPKGSFYPPEVCEILADQGFRGELTNSEHAKNMLSVACKPPKENADEIVNRGLHLLEFRNSNPVLDAFGVHVGNEMAKVPGRVLDKPGLLYSAKAAEIDNRASWNLRGVKFAVGARLDRWAVLVIQDNGRSDFRDSAEAWGIADGFRKMCNTSGMQVQPLGEGAIAEVRLPRKERDSFRSDAMELIERTMRDLVGQVRAELVLVMLSNDDKAIYNGIKRLCDVQLDVATVCMQSSKVKNPKGQVQYYANVALKVNMKMGGVNHTLDADSGVWLRSVPTMVMGMDVTHPAKGLSVTGTPSIVAVVASVDDHFAQYPAELALRESKVEIEREGEDDALRDMFIRRFQLYKDKNGRLPERIILFRDGVSESQFTQVRKFELAEMKRAFAHFGPGFQPKLSIVICGKRHHTRFYPTNENGAALDGNPLPGTVVDRGVTPVYEFDFFLQAHGGLKGTTRPTHYFVVHDENGFKADDLQRVTNDLSYMFARATKAVSLVSPAYWADIACERGRCYLHKLLVGGKDEDKDKDKDKDKGKGGKGKKRAEESVFDKAKVLWGDGVSGRLRDTMFYL